MRTLLARTTRALGVAAALALAPIAAPVPAIAGDGCAGTVVGLSNNYNRARGSGFLAVRAAPTTRSAMLDELFNGDRVRIFSRRGNWYEITYSRGTGWAYARYIRNSCGY